MTSTGPVQLAGSEVSGASSEWSNITSLHGRQRQSPTNTSIVSSPTSSDGSGDLEYHFTCMRVPRHKSWAKKFERAGYSDMDQLSGVEDLEAVFNELGVPSGIRIKLKEGVQHFGEGTFTDTYGMPQGDLDATAPLQAEPSNTGWWILGGVAAVGLVALGGLAITAAAAAAEAAAAAAAAEAAAAAAVAEGATAGAAASVGGMMVTGLFIAAMADCLHGDTMVTMSDRSRKKIKDVKVGDKILSYNKNKLRVKTVVEVKEGSSQTMRELMLESSDGKQFSIKATAGHPFFTNEKGWAVVSPEEAHFDASRPVKKLSLGDTLVLRGGAAKLVKIGQTMPTQKTYNLVIDGPGTFFVEGILSHSGLPPAKK